MKNEILLEVWRNRDEFAKRCNYNLDVMVEMLQQVECAPWNPLVDKTKKAQDKRMRRPPRSRHR
ncbi:MAG: hypothetical protein ACE5NM_06645 [Sedimentisphaerales bacterium]